MSQYTFEEYSDMHLVYGKASSNSREARRLYSENFPNRQLPDRKTFEHIDRNLRENELKKCNSKAEKSKSPSWTSMCSVYTIPNNTPANSSISLDSNHLLCANESCPYQFKYEECILTAYNKEVDLKKICSVEYCDFKIHYEECFPEPEKKTCIYKDCPFVKRYGHCGISIEKAIEHESKCTNIKCRLKMLCQSCNMKKLNPFIPKLCENEFCPYKTFYEECYDLGKRLVQGEEDNLGLCTNEYCPYFAIYKQCEVFASDDELCNIHECPYKQILFTDDSFEQKGTSNVSLKQSICKYDFCPYRMLYEEVAIRVIQGESISQPKSTKCDLDPTAPVDTTKPEQTYVTESTECIIDPMKEICDNEICPIKNQSVLCNIDPKTEICSEETCRYKTESVQYIVDSSIETNTTEEIDVRSSSCISQYVECNIESAMDICSNELCYYKTRYVECFPEKSSSLLEETASDRRTYKHDRCAQFTDTYFVIDDMLDDIMSLVSAEVTFAVSFPECIFKPPCVLDTCKILKRQKLDLCMPFKEICMFVEYFVDDIISIAAAEAEKKTNRKSIFQMVAKHKFFDDIVKDVPRKVNWPSIEEFDVNLGAQKITEFVTSFDVTEQWVCGIYYTRSSEELISDFHYYEVIYSLPSNIYPVAQVTARIFFTIEVSKVIPKQCPVEVTYQMETNRCVHNVDTSLINEKWLLQILHGKMRFFSSVTF